MQKAEILPKIRKREIPKETRVEILTQIRATMEKMEISRMEIPRAMGAMVTATRTMRSNLLRNLTVARKHVLSSRRHPHEAAKANVWGRRFKSVRGMALLSGCRGDMKASATGQKPSQTKATVKDESWQGLLIYHLAVYTGKKAPKRNC